MGAACFECDDRIEILDRLASRSIDNERLAEHIKQLGTGVILLWVIDGAGRHTFADGHQLMLLRENKPSAAFLACVQPEDRSKVSAFYEALMAGCESPAIEYRVCLAPGRERWILETRIPRPTEDAAVPRPLGIALDITAVRDAARFLEHTYQVRGQDERVPETQGDLLATVIDLMCDGFCLYDSEQRLIFCNRQYAEMYNIPPCLLIPGTKLRDILRYRIDNGYFAGECPEDYIKERMRWVARGKMGDTVQSLSDGRTIRICHKPTADGGWLTVHSDITELQHLNYRFHTALDNMSQGLCMFDGDKRLIVCNKRYLDLYDLPSVLSEPGTPFRSIVEHRVKSGIYAGEDAAAYIDERLAAVEERTRTTKIQKLTNDRVVAIVHKPMANGGWLATHEDITELQRVQDRLAHMALHDGLTDLPNRMLLRERIEEIIPHAKRGRKFALHCIDLDRFKHVNDTLGHACGDELLKMVAKRLSECLRETDTVARLGGDEFAVLQISDNLPKDSTALAARLCGLLSKPITIGDHQVVVGASIGISVAPDDGCHPDKLMKHADMALYRAKNDGRGVYRYFAPEMDARMQARRSLELDLRSALKLGEFELHYQPQFDANSGELTGFEALLRWPHATRGNVPPAEFIPVAEEIGIISPLGEWVVRKACADAMSWPENVRIAVNVSPAQFHSENMVAVVVGALAQSGLSPNRLEIEITENALLESSEVTLKTLHGLRELGVRIVMDDFGTGYSSLSYLRSFPFDKIKIDGSFIQQLSEEDQTCAIVNAVANLSRNLGMTSTAECVETEEQRQSIKAAGYTEMQGFLFSPALPLHEVVAKYFPETQTSAASA